MPVTLQKPPPGERSFYRGMVLDDDDDGPVVVLRDRKAGGDTRIGPARQAFSIGAVCLVVVVFFAVTDLVRAPRPGEVRSRVGFLVPAVIGVGALVAGVIARYPGPALRIDLASRTYRRDGPWWSPRLGRSREVRPLDDFAAVRVRREERTLRTGKNQPRPHSVIVVTLAGRSGEGDDARSVEVGSRPNVDDLGQVSSPPDYAAFVSEFAARLAGRLGLPLDDQVEAERVVPMVRAAEPVNSDGTSPVPVAAWAPPPAIAGRIGCEWGGAGRVTFTLPDPSGPWLRGRLSGETFAAAGLCAAAALFLSNVVGSVLHLRTPPVAILSSVSAGAVVGLALWVLGRGRERWGATTLTLARGRLAEARRLGPFAWKRLDVSARAVQRVHAEDAHLVLSLGWEGEAAGARGGGNVDPAVAGAPLSYAPAEYRTRRHDFA